MDTPSTAPQSISPTPDAAKTSGSSPPQTMAQVEKLVMHPDHDLIPEMRPDEYRGLLGDIRSNDILTPIEVAADGFTVLDGRHRLRAAKELGLKKVPVRAAPLGAGNPQTYMVKAAMLRRHLTDDQRAMVAAYYAKANSKRGGDRRSKEARQNQTDPTGGSLKGKAKDHPALAEAAKAVNVTMSKATKANEVLRANAKLAARVHAGEEALAAAHKAVEKPKKKRVGVENETPPVAAALPPQGGSKVEPAATPTRTAPAAGSPRPKSGSKPQSAAVPMELTPLTAQGKVEDLGQRLRAPAEEVERGIGEVAAILERNDIVDLGDSWTWTSRLSVQLSRVTSLLRQNDDRAKAIHAHAEAKEADQEVQVSASDPRVAA